MNFLAQEGPTIFGLPNQLVVAAVLGGLAILACLSAYAAQRWAHQCYLELKKMNETLGELKSDSPFKASERPSSYLDSHESEERAD